MKVTSGAANFHRNGNINEPAGRSTFEFTGEEVAEILLKHVKETLEKPASDAQKVYTKCPKCETYTETDDLKVSLVVNFY